MVDHDIYIYIYVYFLIKAYAGIYTVLTIVQNAKHSSKSAW